VSSALRRLILVSNRGPISYLRGESGRSARRGGGGLVTALGPLVARYDVTWVANAMTDEDRVVAAEAGGAFEETGRDGSPYRLRLVAHEPEVFDRFYNRFANPTLWFLQHGLRELLGSEPLEEAWHAYRQVNEALAAAVLDELADAPGTPVWFHDYHLYLAPAVVREASPGAALSHFVHIPWPEPGAWDLLPAEAGRAIHRGLLANDVIGFHTRRWRDGFLDSVRAILGDVDVPLVTAHPISVDVGEFDGLRESAEVLAEERELGQIRSERMILRVDRTDPTKNIVRGFEAFALYLEAHPEAHGRVGMLALLDPSRQDIAQYTTYLDEIVEAAGRVNDRFATAGWLPVALEIQDNFARSVAAYKQYDVLFVNAVSDGLNLVAKEAPLVNGRGGAVVLSRNAGVFEEIGPWTVAVDPLDVAGQARALHEALELPERARLARAESIQTHVRRHDLGEWLRLQLADLDRVSALT
jgi:trehalose 6-phosphate synthase